jgi:hypothetical protein
MKRSRSKSSRSEFSKQVLSVMCVLSLVLTLVPLGSAFAVNGGEGQTEQSEPITEPAASAAEEAEPADDPVAPVPGEDDPAEQEAALEAPPAEAGALEQPASQDAIQPLSEDGSLALLEDEDYQYSLELVLQDPDSGSLVSTVDVTGSASSFDLGSWVHGIKLVDTNDPASPITIPVDDLVANGATLDWSDAGLDGFEEDVAFDGDSVAITWTAIGYTHYKGTVKNLKLSIDPDAFEDFEEFLEDELSISEPLSFTVADNVDIPESFSIPINFNPTVGPVVGNTAADLGSDIPPAYYVNNETTEGAQELTIPVTITNTLAPYQGVVSATWELLNEDDSELPVPVLGTLDFTGADDTVETWPTFDDLREQAGEVLEGTVSIPWTSIPSSDRYKLSIRVKTGKTLNEAVATSTFYVINDTEAPEINVVYSAPSPAPTSPPAAVDGYFQGLTVTVTVSDNEGFGGTGPYTIVYEKDDEPVTAELELNDDGDLEVAIVLDEDQTHSKDGSYAFSVTTSNVLDKVGNSAELNGTPAPFTIDTEAPTGDIKLDGSIAMTTLDDPSYNLVNGTDLVVLSGEDNGSGVWQYQYFRATPEEVDAFPGDSTFEELADVFGSPGPVMLPEGETSFDASDAQGAVDRYVYVLKIWDKAGNVRYLMSNGIILDTAAPQIDSITFDQNGNDPGDGSTNNIFNNDVVVTFTAHDQVQEASTQVSNGHAQTASGLSEAAHYTLSYIASNDDRILIAEGVVNLNDPAEGLDENSTWEEIAGSLDPDNPWSFAFGIPKTYDEYPQVEVVISVKDRAGNRVEGTEAIRIDSTAPAVSVSYGDAPVDGTTNVFAAGRTAALVVTDLNFDPEAAFGDDPAYLISATRTHSSPTSDGGTGGVPLPWPGEPLGWNAAPVTTKDATTVSTSIAFDEDGDYTLDIDQLTDLAGNKIEFDIEGDPGQTNGIAFDPAEAPWDFAVDATRPVLTVSYTNEYNGEPFVDTFDDTYFKGRKVTVSITDAGGFNEQAEPYTIAFERDRDPGAQSADVETGTLEAVDSYTLEWTGNLSATDPETALNNLEQGDYDFTAITTTAIDRAQQGPGGYTSPLGQIDSFTIDSGLPTGYIELDNTPPHSISYNPVDEESYTYPSERAKQEVAVILSGEDGSGSGVWKYRYFRVTPSSVATIPDNAKFAELASMFETADNGGFGTVEDEAVEGRVFDVSASQDKDDRYIYVLQVIDRAGNVNYFVSNGIIVDTVDPQTPIIKFFGENDNPEGIFTGNVTVGFAANDQEPLAVTGTGIVTASGLTGSATYKVEYVKPDGFTVPVTEGSRQTASGTIGADPTWADILQNLAGQKDFSFGIDGTVDEYSTVRVTVTVEDRAGNTSTASKELSIDNTSPRIVIGYDNNAAENDRYFKAGRVATLSVTDLNFDASLIRVDSQQSASWGAFRPGNKTGAGVTGTIAYPDDGEYTLAVAGTDKAGNPAVVTYEGVAPQDFIVDLTAPVLSVAYDNNNARNDRYYNAGRTGIVTVVEQNFSDAGATVSATRDGAAFSSGGGWSSSGTTHNSSIPFSTDGDYTLSASYTDLAGNPANTLPDDDFVVDLTAPVIEFGDAVTNRSAHADAVTPEVLFRDRNYDSSGKSIVIEGYKNRQVPVSVSYFAITDGEQGTVGDLEHVSGNDDIYVLTATQTDLAGNETIETIMYSVNRFGSTWYLDGSSKDLVDGYYANAAREVQIHEVNVNEVVEHSVSLSHDGNLSTLGTREGYRVLASGDDASWREYVYALEAQNFESEGLYEITVHSTDAVKNTSSNVSPRVAESACPVSFVIDKTAPAIVLTGVEEGGRYAEDSRTVVVDVQDNTAVDTLDIYLNGSAAPVASYSGEEVESSNGQVEYVMQASNTPQEFAVVARDVAGNTSDRMSVADIFISSSNIMIAELSVPRAGLVGGGISLLAIAAVVAGLLVAAALKKKKKKKELA